MITHRRLLMPLRPAAVVSTGISSPADIANLRLWLDFSDASSLYTDDMVTNVTANDDLIYAAEDKSGNGNHFKQATESKRHTYKTNIQNSLSASYAYEDNLRSVSSFNLNQDTIFVAGKHVSDANARFIYGCFSEQSIYSQSSKLKAGNNSGTPIELAYTSNTNFILCVVIADSGYFQLNANSTTGDTFTNRSAGNNDLGMYNNLYGPASGYYYEVIVYDRELSASQISQVMDYLSDKWNIAVT